MSSNPPQNPPPPPQLHSGGAAGVTTCPVISSNVAGSANKTNHLTKKPKR